ncbi:sodium:solute symporter family protein [Seongchinamella sediminis]|uniref:Sodium:solute symporter family protein n=1 Tax=Seongchinamella sediminis TaxID=2283635 RepID=A0A3L7DVW9_9GAMM|nr:sodium:solute symporter family protein [Seongchinamella sediminis]RLQ21454.1 sodium:solute symporter family protein [Seongchinamella sediminis]
MTTWLIILGGIYIGLLVYATIDARRRINTSDDYVMAGSDIGLFFGFLTFAATLFSTFTLLGMPDFFRTHGIGSWIFLAVADAGMAFVIVWFAFHLRRKAFEKGFNGVAGLLRDCYRNRWAGYLYLGGIFVFLVPYVAVQVRGIGIFLNAVFPDTLPVWGWASSIVVAMLIYSELGGLKAIIYSDALQGSVLFTVTGIIAYGCVENFGGVSAMFEQVKAENAALLSVPGPKGLFTTQFLLASFLVILMVPITQPQLTTRLVILRDMRTAHRMAVAVGLFALLLILMIIPIGLYGAINYADASVIDFLANTIIFDQAPVVAAAVAIGLIAAAMSTADSQIFALGTELRSLLSGDEKKVMKTTKLAIICFAMAGLVVAIISGNQLVLLARVSFAGTAMMAPFVLAAILSSRPPGLEIIVATAAGLLLFLGSVTGFVPEMVGPFRLDLLLLLSLSTLTILSLVYRKFTHATSGGEHAKAQSWS